MIDPTPIEPDEPNESENGQAIRFSELWAKDVPELSGTEKKKLETDLKSHGLTLGDFKTVADAKAALRELDQTTMDRACASWEEQPNAEISAEITTLDEKERAEDHIWEASASTPISNEATPELLRRYPVQSTAELQDHFPNPPAPVLEGIIGEGEKLILGGSSKAGKTYCLLNLASAIANGGKWLGHQCRKGRVLFLNFEVSEPRMAERNRLLKSAGVEMAGVDFLNLRGAQFDWTELIGTLEYLTRLSRYSLIILDPIYKLLGATPENDNTAVAEMLAEVERIAVETKAAVAFAHHFSKGNKADVVAMDRLSGAGAFARDPDAILTLTEHEERNCFVLETTTRNFITPAPVTVEYIFPRFAGRGDLDSTKLKQSKRGGGHNKKGGADTVVETLAVGVSMTSAVLQKALKDRTGANERSARRWMSAALESGAVEEAQGLWRTPDE